MYVSIYVTVWQVCQGSFCGWMVSYADECHEKLSGLMINQVGRVALTNFWGQ